MGIVTGNKIHERISNRKGHIFYRVRRSGPLGSGFWLPKVMRVKETGQEASSFFNPSLLQESEGKKAEGKTK
jgi:hypothetical protein